MEHSIQIKNARVHNLKGIDVEIPHNSLTVITGLSGSGKSSLAFDTLYAEGQRRYVESLSAYVRQFLGKINKPEVDSIIGIPPAVAIEQKVNIRNPHSTVGSTTEIYDYIRLLFARIGKTYSPISGAEVKQDSVESVVEFVQQLPENTKIILLCNIDHSPSSLASLLQQGFARIESEGQYHSIQNILDTETPLTSARLVIDRLVTNNTQSFVSRLTDSIETAFYEGNGTCFIDVLNATGSERHTFSKELEIDGIRFSTPSEQLFNYNSPMGACPTCEGFGNVVGIDHNLVIPDTTLSVYEDAVACWKGEIMGEWKRQVINTAHLSNFPIHKPYEQLSHEQKQMLWNGTRYFEGINAFFKQIEAQQYKIQYRVMLARYRGKTTCPDCHGTRLKQEAHWVKINGKSIVDLLPLPITSLKEFFSSLTLSGNEAIIAKRILTEITTRIELLTEVGLGYLQLNRPSNTLSGGESQRINLVTSIGSGLVGSLYILDEPSIGLHSKDTFLLIKVLRKLQSLGNTVVVVEHDEDIIRSADYIIDIGPQAGRLGGEVVFQGDMERLMSNNNSSSLTYQYLAGVRQIPIPAKRRNYPNYIELQNASINNLKNVTIRIPLNEMVVVTGVSGSGKSSLIREALYQALHNYYVNHHTKQKCLTGHLNLLSGVEYVDQNPIGKSSRSNPATYLKAFDEIRKLFAEQALAKQLGYSPAYFSFNTEGGRCEACQGEGKITMEMQFMADVEMECEHCHGKRFKQDVLDVQYRGNSIYDVLEMTVNQAIEFFTEEKNSTTQRIVRRLKPLQDVGLGYIKLGQSSSTLSGGENQRVKLAAFLANEHQSPTLFIFDEPTIGLHFHDINVLLKAFHLLIDKGHTVLIIEHNLDIAKCADYIIDMGPDGGNKGGEVVFQGTPEQLLNVPQSHTARYLKEKLQQ